MSTGEHQPGGVVSPVSFVSPARNEADSLGETLSSIEAMRTDRSYRVVVADGGSTNEPLSRYLRLDGGRVRGGRGAATGMGGDPE